jgi:hypothetical protein
MAALAAEDDDPHPVLHDHTLDGSTAAAGKLDESPVLHQLPAPPDGAVLCCVGNHLSCLHRKVRLCSVDRRVHRQRADSIATPEV